MGTGAGGFFCGRGPRADEDKIGFEDPWVAMYSRKVSDESEARGLKQAAFRRRGDIVDEDGANEEVRKAALVNGETKAIAQTLRCKLHQTDTTRKLKSRYKSTREQLAFNFCGSCYDKQRGELAHDEGIN